MKILCALLLLLVDLPAVSQKLPDIGMNVRIIEDDKTIVAEVRPIGSEPKPDAQVYYYWYSAGIIHQTQGGYSGKLLNGIYNEYYLNKNLRQQGAFNKGQRKGVWKIWTEKGTLQQVYDYKNGMKSGDFYLYDDNGTLKQSGKYDNDKLDGKIRSYDNGKITVTRYKNGNIVEVKKSNSFWNKINIFKKIHFKSKKPKTNK